MKKFMAVLAMVAVVAFAAPALAATNPFMDVPQGHWAYDAVGLLASRGIVSGYPDGAYKGAQPATRYEIASVVARALVTVDAEKASKQDLELLKKLVMEFKDELDALGVKVDKIDKRVAVLEKNLGGWSLAGELRHDWKVADEDKGAYGDKYQSTMNRVRLHIRKSVDENTSFYARINGTDAKFARYMIDTKLPYDIKFRVGYAINVDWEGDLGFYNPNDIGNDATFGDFNTTGFQFSKAWDKFSAVAVIGRNSGLDAWLDGDADHLYKGAKDEKNLFMTYALKLNMDFNEQFTFGAMGYWLQGDRSVTSGDTFNAPDVSTYSLYAKFAFNPMVALQGIYYWQSVSADDNVLAALGRADWSNTNSWKAQLVLEQDLLKFTSLWIEYAQEDNLFLGNNLAGATYDWIGANPTANRKNADGKGTSKTFFVRADQKWNDKWGTFLRYAQFDFDTEGLDDTKNYSAGVTYQYTPAISFRLAYDYLDYGDTQTATKGTDNVIAFRTTVNF